MPAISAADPAMTTPIAHLTNV
ncbi:hypothetical protein MCW_01147, partial [Cardidatus Bartonella washoeensis 085-0475]